MATYKKLSALLFLISLLSCQYRSAESYVKQGHEMGLLGDYKDAIELYDKAIKIDPKCIDAYLDKGLCLEYTQKYNEAIKQYRTILSLDSSNTVAIFSIGLCKSKQKDFAESIVYFNRALNSKGVSGLQDTVPQIVLEYSSEGIMGDKAKFDVEASEIYFQRGYAYLCNDQHLYAYRDLENCINSNYNLGASYYLIGQCWLRANDKNAKWEAYKAFKSGYAYGDSLSKVEMDKLNF